MVCTNGSKKIVHMFTIDDGNDLWKRPHGVWNVSVQCLDYSQAWKKKCICHQTIENAKKKNIILKINDNKIV